MNLVYLKILKWDLKLKNKSFKVKFRSFFLNLLFLNPKRNLDELIYTVKWLYVRVNYIKCEVSSSLKKTCGFCIIIIIIIVIIIIIIE